MPSIFVGNIAWGISEQQLGDEFANFGNVNSVKIITDRDTGKSRGFGFVDFADASCIPNAIKNMDGKSLGGRQLRVNEATQRN